MKSSFVNSSVALKYWKKKPHQTDQENDKKKKHVHVKISDTKNVATETRNYNISCRLGLCTYHQYDQSVQSTQRLYYEGWSGGQD